MHPHISPAPGGYVRHRTSHWLGIIRPDEKGCWADAGGIRIHWLATGRPPDDWYDLDSLRVIS